MPEALVSSPFFGLLLTVACWCGGLWLQKKTKLLICNPTLVAMLLGIAVLSIFRIPLEAYNVGADIVKLMLAPATAVLALNIYRQRAVLREYFLPVLAGCIVGSLASIGSVFLLCRLFRTDDVFTASMLPKSVTTAIAVALAETRGGLPGITAASVVLTGVEGAVCAPLFARLFRVADPVAEGLALGACSHALGTSKALELGQLQGAMSSVSLCVCGIVTSLLTLFF